MHGESDIGSICRCELKANKVVVHIFHFIQDARFVGAPRSNWIIDTFPILFPAMVYVSHPIAGIEGARCFFPLRLHLEPCALKTTKRRIIRLETCNSTVSTRLSVVRRWLV